MKTTPRRAQLLAAAARAMLAAAAKAMPAAAAKATAGKRARKALAPTTPGGSAGTDDGAAGEGGQPPILGCTHLSEFVHSVFKDDTTANSSPRPVNGVVFCDDPADSCGVQRSVLIERPD